jgi:stage II sporulation protein AA (anti-sigma F factor antagonist)
VRVQITQERRGEALVVRVAGALDVGSAEEFRAAVDASLADAPCRRLVLNLSRVTFLDSSGLGAVLGRLRRARAHGCEMAVVPPSGLGRTLLDTAALARAVPVFRSERAALGEEAHPDA